MCDRCTGRTQPRTTPLHGRCDHITTGARHITLAPPLSRWIHLVRKDDAPCHLGGYRKARGSCEPMVPTCGPKKWTAGLGSRAAMREHGGGRASTGYARAVRTKWVRTLPTWQTYRTASCQQLPVLVFEQHRGRSLCAGCAGAAHGVAEVDEAAKVHLKALRRRGTPAHVKGELIQGSGKVCKVLCREYWRMATTSRRRRGGKHARRLARSQDQKPSSRQPTSGCAHSRLA